MFDYLCNCKSVCIAVEDHCLQTMKIGHHYTNCDFDLLISGHQSSIVSGKQYPYCLGNSGLVTSPTRGRNSEDNRKEQILEQMYSLSFAKHNAGSQCLVPFTNFFFIRF